MGLITSLNTAIAGLNATQVVIGVVSQNVSNAGTTGYVRRTVSTSDSLSGLTVGTQSTQVQRLLDKIVQHQLWQESAGAAYTSTRATMPAAAARAPAGSGCGGALLNEPANISRMTAAAMAAAWGSTPPAWTSRYPSENGKANSVGCGSP